MATDTFVDSGFVDDDYLQSLSLATHQYATRFGEYRRGSIGGDWKEIYTTAMLGRINTTGSNSRIEGAACDLHHRNSLRLIGGLSGTRTGVMWVTPSTDANFVDQECLATIRVLTSYTSGREVILLRAGGTLGAENYYAFAIDASGSHIYIQKRVAGVLTTLATASKTIAQFGYYRVRFRAEGTGLQLKLWPWGTTEPVPYDLTVSDASIAAAGDIGFHCQSTTETIEVSFFSVGTGGEPAPDDSILGTPLDTWISDVSDTVEITLRTEFYDPALDAVRDLWYSNLGRTTGPADFPSNTLMDALLIDPGAITNQIAADAFLPGASLPSLDPVRLLNLSKGQNTAGPLDDAAPRSYYGRPIELRLGRRYAVKPGPRTDGVVALHRTFEIIACGLPSAEPAIDADQASISLATPADTILQSNLNAYRNVGVPIGVKSLTSSGWVSIPSSSGYDLTSFNIYFRVLVPLAGVAGSTFCTLSRRQISSTFRQWIAELHSASHATLANRLQFICDSSGGVPLVSVAPTLLMNQARFIDVIFGVNGNQRWYILVDGTKAGSGSLVGLGSPNTATGFIVELLTDTSTGVIICDHRIEQFVDEDTAISRFSARRDPDSRTVSMHRCDDATGNTVTDYATLANHGTLQGVNVTDRVWAPTYLGSSNLIGSSMPMSGGVVYHLPTQTIDPVNNGFRFSDRTKTSGASVAVRSKGKVLTIATDYTEPADGPGTIDAVGAIDQPVTTQLVAAAGTEDPHIHIAQLVRDELIARGPMTYRTLDADSFDGLRKLLPMKGGFYYDAAPQINAFIGDSIGSLGGSYGLDRSGRVAASYLLPTINPGPYGQDALLEFHGLPYCGVTFAWQTGYDLKQQTTYSVTAIIKTPAQIIDASVSSSFTYFPSGMTIIDHTLAATGYYLGIDGRDGYIVFGAPGVTNGGGANFAKLTYALNPNTYYVIHGFEAVGTRGIQLCTIDSGGSVVIVSMTESITGAMTAGTGAPLRIGYGQYGSFLGCIVYVIGAGGLHTGNFASAMGVVRPVIGSENGLLPYNTQDRYWIDLRDGSGDTALDQVTGAVGKIVGCSWCPRVTMDFYRAVTPRLGSVRRPLSAWSIDAQINRNYQTLGGTDIDASVSAADRQALGLGQVSDADLNKTRLANYLDSLAPVLQTPLVTAADEAFIRALVATRAGVDRRYANVQGWYREGLKLGLYDEVLVRSPRFGLSAGRPMRVVGLVRRLNQLTADADLWG